MVLSSERTGGVTERGRQQNSPISCCSQRKSHGNRLRRWLSPSWKAANDPRECQAFAFSSLQLHVSVSLFLSSSMSIFVCIEQKQICDFHFLICSLRFLLFLPSYFLWVYFVYYLILLFMNDYTILYFGGLEREHTLKPTNTGNATQCFLGRPHSACTVGGKDILNSFCTLSLYVLEIYV